jgi:hypothetical protein
MHRLSFVQRGSQRAVCYYTPRSELGGEEDTGREPTETRCSGQACRVEPYHLSQDGVRT